jgi:hypothetical protein
MLADAAASAGPAVGNAADWLHSFMGFVPDSKQLTELMGQARQVAAERHATGADFGQRAKGYTKGMLDLVDQAANTGMYLGGTLLPTQANVEGKPFVVPDAMRLNLGGHFDQWANKGSKTPTQDAATAYLAQLVAPAGTGMKASGVVRALAEPGLIGGAQMMGEDVKHYGSAKPQDVAAGMAGGAALGGLAHGAVHIPLKAAQAVKGVVIKPKVPVVKDAAAPLPAKLGEELRMTPDEFLQQLGKSPTQLDGEERALYFALTKKQIEAPATAAKTESQAAYDAGVKPRKIGDDLGFEHLQEQPAPTPEELTALEQYAQTLPESKPAQPVADPKGDYLYVEDAPVRDMTPDELNLRRAEEDKQYAGTDKRFYDDDINGTRKTVLGKQEGGWSPRELTDQQLEDMGTFYARRAMSEYKRKGDQARAKALGDEQMRRMRRRKEGVPGDWMNWEDQRLHAMSDDQLSSMYDFAASDLKQKIEAEINSRYEAGQQPSEPPKTSSVPPDNVNQPVTPDRQMRMYLGGSYNDVATVHFQAPEDKTIWSGLKSDGIGSQPVKDFMTTHGLDPMNGEDRVAAMKALKDWQAEVKTQAKSSGDGAIVKASSPADFLPNKPQPLGEFRTPRPYDAGRKKVASLTAPEGLRPQTADTLDFVKNDPRVMEALPQLAQKKAEFDHAVAVSDDLSRQLLDRLEAEHAAGNPAISKAADGHYVYKNGKRLRQVRRDIEKELTSQGQELVDKERARLQQDPENLDGPPEQRDGFVKGLLDRAYGTSADQLKMQPAKLHENLDQAFDQVIAARKQSSMSGPIRKQYDKLRKNYKTDFERAEAAYKAHTGDEQAHLLLNEKTKTPYGEEATAQIEYQKGPLVQKLRESARQFVKELEDNLKSDPKFSRATTKWSVKATAAGGAAWLAELAGKSHAEAANAAAQHAAVAQHVAQTLTGNPYSDFAAVTAATIAVAPKAAKALLTDKKLAWAGYWYKNTKDHLAYLDKHFDTNLVGELNKGSGLAYRSTFGVKIAPEVKAKALHELRSGAYTMDEAYGGAGAFKEMTAAQREAVLRYRSVQKELIKAIDRQKEKVAGYLKENDLTTVKDIKDPLLRDAAQALEWVKHQMGAPPAPGDRGQDMFFGAVRNFYDNAFFWNPDFHLTNLTDPWLAGMMTVGPRKMARAYQLLGPGGDAELQKFFRGIDAVGGQTGEAGALRGQAGGGAKKLLSMDLPSDKINTDRTMLASFLQYAEKNGHKNDLEYVKKILLDKSTPPEVTAEAWAYMLDKTSDTLGLDPYRIYVDALARHPALAAFSMLARQPARVSRLVFKNMAEGNWRGVMLFLGMTAAVGGKSAISSEEQYAWKEADPEAFFAAAKAFDDADLIHRISGSRLGPKVEYSMLWPFVTGKAATAKDDVIKTASDAKKAWDSGWKLHQELQSKKAKPVDLANWIADTSQKLLTDIAPYALPKIGPVPTRIITRGMGAAKQMREGEIPVYEPGFHTGHPVTLDTINMEHAGISPLTGFFDQFNPGGRGDVYNAQMAGMERKALGTNKYYQAGYTEQGIADARRKLPKGLTQEQKNTTLQKQAESDLPWDPIRAMAGTKPNVQTKRKK